MLVSTITGLPGWNLSLLVLLAKATLILVAALGTTLAMQRSSAGARHLVWLATLGMLLLVPALTALGSTSGGNSTAGSSGLENSRGQHRSRAGAPKNNTFIILLNKLSSSSD